MNKLEYIPGKVPTRTVQMDGPISYVGTADNIRSRAWGYELGYRDLLSANRPAREVDATFHADYETLDELRRVADADVDAKMPGTFVAEGEWKQRGYIVSSDPSMIHWGRVETELKILLLDGAWWRLVSTSFGVSDDESSSTYLDYQYDYQYDYSQVIYASSVESSVLTPSDIRLVIYGPATNPFVNVGPNKYQVNVTVPSGGYVVVDGRDKTITLVLANGTVQNAFQYGVRGTGQGGGQYVFEPLESGPQDVSWDGSFGFDLGWYEEEGEPPWSLS